MSRNSKKLNPQNVHTEDQENLENQEELDEEGSSGLGSVRERFNNPFGIPFVVPTDVVELPTKGDFYPRNSPLYGVGQIEIRHMTAKEEDILSSVQNNDTGTFDRLIDSLMVDKDLTSDLLVEEDKMAILLKARISGYGNIYTTTAACLACGEKVEHQFDLTKTSIVQPSNDSEYDPDNNSFVFTLPVSKIEVELENFNRAVEEELEEEKKQKEKYNLPFNYTLSYLEKVIKSANDISERKMIKKLVEVLPAADAKTIMNFHDGCRPSLSTEQKVKCPSCNAETEREVPLSWAFFRTDI